MNERFKVITGLAVAQHSAVSLKQLAAAGVDADTRKRWVAGGLIERLGPQSFAIAGSEPTWERAAWAAMTDLDGFGYLAGRTGARLHGLDSFTGDEIEGLVTRSHKGVRSPHRIASTSLALPKEDTVTINGIRCVTAQRLILDAPLFEFSKAEIENAIDSSIRLKKLGEQRLRAAVVKRHRRGINHGLVLLDALVDTGGESRLERWFLALVRRGGMPRPTMQKTWREQSRTVARIDAFFAGDLVVELSGHATHSSRTARQRDEQRRTELTLRGLRVITFTYDDIRDRPDWVISRLREALAMTGG